VVDMKSQFAVAVLSFGVISSNVALAFGLTSSEPAPASSPGSSREYVRVAGQRLIAAGDREFRIRAIGAGSLSADPIEDDYERIAQLKFNAVTVMLSYQRLYNEAKPGEYLESGWQRLDAHLALARKYGLYLILEMADVEGAQFVPSKGQAVDYRVWIEPELQEKFCKLWEAIATHYKNAPEILGYGVLCEPVVAGTRQQWIDLASKAAARIRNVDKNHILFMERIYGGFSTRREMSGVDLNPERSFFLIPDSNVVYQFYFFERDEYTHQHAPWREDRDADLRYPAPKFEIVYREALNDRGRILLFDRNYLSFYLTRQLDFGRKHKMPMFVWDFGLLKNCFHEKGGLQWLQDTRELFDRHQLHWSYVAYRDDDFGINYHSDALRVLAPSGG